MNIPYAFKKCKTCGEWKVASNINFSKNKGGKWGLNYKCKKCTNKYNKEYYGENKDRIKEYNKEYRKENKEYYKEYNKEYRRENKDKIKKHKKQYYEENKDKKREYDKEYYKKNKEYKLKKIKEYNIKNRDKLREYHKKYGKEYRKNNPEKVFNRHNKRRSKLKNQGRGITKEQLNECRNWFGGKCAYSGEILKKSNDTYGRTIDHIVALNNRGLNEPWNVVPMRKGYNCSKQDKVNSLDWYMEKEYFDIDRLNKIVE